MEWRENEIKGQGPLNLYQGFSQGNLKAHLLLFLFFTKKS